jgi:polysaccharide export outer membrane protein
MKTFYVLLFLIVQGCTFVSRDGPSTDAITSTTKHYIVVNLDKTTADAVKSYYDNIIPAPLAVLPSPRPIGRIGVGDVLSITIWETSLEQGGVFIKGNGTDVKVVVGDKGDIAVPYAGRFKVAGMTLSKIEATLIKNLKGKAYLPQVTVQLTQNVFNTVFVQGEVGTPGRFALSPGGDRVLDLIALAGGPRLQPHETVIQLRRKDRSISLDLYRIMQDASLNITLSPGDSIIATRRQDRFFAFGAVNRSGEIPFSEHTTTLLQAMGAIYGLQDQRADPSGLFIFRREPRELIASLPSIKRDGALPESVQVAYQLDMDNPESIFVLGVFPVHPSDIIYVSNSPLREFQKVVESVFGSAGNVLSTGLSAATLAKQ